MIAGSANRLFGSFDRGTRSRTVLWIMVGILLAATVVRFYLIDAQSMWHDEGVSYRLALRSWGDAATAVATEVHVPAYFWALNIWIKLTGETVFAMRLFSALLSIFSVALTYALGKRLYGRPAGLVAAAFVMLNTFSIYYAQEMRMYAMLTVTGAASMWFFVGFVKRPTWRDGVAFGVLNAVGIYTHYSYPFTMVAQGVLMVLWLGALVAEAVRRPGSDPALVRAVNRVRPTLVKYIGANLLTILLFSPWIANGLFQLSVQPNISPAVPMEDLLRAIQGWFAFGSTFEYNIGGMGVAMYFFLLFGLMILPAQEQKPRAWWWMLVPVIWVLVSTAIFIYLELYLRYLRFLLPAQVGFALWMGRGVWVLWTVRTRVQTRAARYLPRFAAAFATIGLLVNMFNGLDPLYHARQFQRDDYRAMAARIKAEARPNDVVILDAPGQAEVFMYYYDAEAPVFPLPNGKDDDRTLAQTRDIIAGYDRIFALLWGMAEQDPHNIVESTLNREAFQASDEWYGDVRFVRYATPAEFTDIRPSEARFGDSIMLQGYALNGTRFEAGDVLQVHLQWRTDAALTTRYKVFVQLLNPDGTLAAQRDAEPGGGQALTTTWAPGDMIIDNHALILRNDLPPAHYALIIGLYDVDDPQARLPVDGGDYLALGTIEVD